MSGALFQEQNKQRVKNKQTVNNNRTNPPQADNKFRNDPSYIEFKQQTSPLLLLPPPLYKAIPNLIQVTPHNCLFFNSVQCLFCCEFPFYNKLSEERGELTKDNLEEGQVGRFG